MSEVLITELRTRFYSPGVQVIYRAGTPIGGGDRRIVSDNLGFMSTTADGLWILEVGSRTKTAHATQADALAAAVLILGN